jgi:MFS family permease
MTSVRLGLRANAAQFSLLVGLNALVGAMVGLERSVLPLVGQHDFGLQSKTLILSFVLAFGVAKALTNLAAGSLAEQLGRKRVLVIGWLAAAPVPLLIGVAPSWGFIVAANILLGINQGLAWSMTVIMKIDLAGPARRGLALGLNEAAGYLGVAAAAFTTGVLAASYAPRCCRCCSCATPVRTSRWSSAVTATAVPRTRCGPRLQQPLSATRCCGRAARLGW